MGQRHKFRAGSAALAIGLAALTACTAQAEPPTPPVSEVAFAQSTPPLTRVEAESIPVLVLGDDSEKGSIKRSSGLYREVSITLQTQLARHGFHVVDAESAGARIGFDFPDRMDRTELFDLFRGIDGAGLASMDVRALVIFRVHASVKQQEYGSRIQTRVTGEVFDGETNRIVNSFALPPEAYPGPADCLDNLTDCIDMTIRPRAGDIAANLGDVLSYQLAAYAPPKLAAANDIPADMIGAGSALCAQPRSIFTVELRQFATDEARAITRVMDEEFPCRIAIDLMTGSNTAVRRYKYVTVAKRDKIEEWMHILLRDMGYDTDGPVRISLLSGNILRVDKIVP
ncbi:MAG: hypothetical protein JJ878_17290 [Alphaproteobacteria bacterium]|nr:hypothetical protein [Alphaproteobacteria bacterium]MBO6864393.1 hypothetical protein [Alphaproteobacteria bacterium]